jgi:peroxiredoxin Q/BCP
MMTKQLIRQKAIRMVNKQIIDFSFAATQIPSGQLADFQGQNVVLYFYPKDATPGCTNEAKEFAALHAQFQQLNAVILGVSKDNMASHERFKKKHNLPFELIADTNGEIAEMFQVFKEKSMFGKTFMGIVRSTFLIDPQGIIVAEWRGVKVAGHAQEVLQTLQDRS